jgi:hypothetical protein
LFVNCPYLRNESDVCRCGITLRTLFTVTLFLNMINCGVI